MSQSPPTAGNKTQLHTHTCTQTHTHTKVLNGCPRNHFTQLTSVRWGPILDFSCKAYLITAALSHWTQLLISFLPLLLFLTPFSLCSARCAFSWEVIKDSTRCPLYSANNMHAVISLLELMK